MPPSPLPAKLSAGPGAVAPGARSAVGSVLVGAAVFAVPLAAFAAMVAFAGFQLDRAGAAETLYLALVAAAVLLATGALAPRPALEPGLGAVLAVTAAWVLPPGPGRGAAVLAVLAASFLLAGLRRLGRTLPELPLAVTVPLALGAQALLRGDLLFQPGLRPRTLVALIALPVAAAAATTLLGRRHGEAALLAGTAALLLAPGSNVAATLALVALAAGDRLGRSDLRWPARTAAVVALLAPIAWEPRAGLVATATGFALGRPREGAAGAVLLAAASAFFPVRSPGEALAQGALLLLLVPVLPLAVRSGGAWRTVAAAALAVGAAFAVPGPAALAAPVALAALSVLSGSRADGAAAVQRTWTAALFAATALLAAYPWLRREPLRQALELFGLAPAPRAALLFCAAASLLAAGLTGLYRRRTEVRRRTEPLAAGLLLLALLLGQPAPGKTLLEGEVVLSGAPPAWEADLADAHREAAGLVVDSILANASDLPPGTPVATVRLRDAAGGSLEWTLRSGWETAEWAAGRSDLVNAGVVAPAPWLSWVAGDFFGQRYRASWQFGGTHRIVHLRIERRPELPTEAALALYHVEVRP